MRLYFSRPHCHTLKQSNIMKGIMFNENYGLETAVITGCKTLTRRRIPFTGNDLKFLRKEPDFPKKYTPYVIGHYARYRVGDIVAVRQSYQTIYNWMRLHGANEPQLIDYELTHRNAPGWSNKMFVLNEEMPYVVEIEAVRVERVQDITDEDALREGVHRVLFDLDDIQSVIYYVPGIKPIGKRQLTYEYYGQKVIAFSTPRDAFHALISATVSPKAWTDNDWQLVYTLRYRPSDNEYFRSYHPYTIEHP